MKILVAPDLHAWYEGPGPADARIEEWRACAECLVEAAAEHACRLALFPGDYFVTNRPTSAQVLAVIDLFKRLEDGAGPQDPGARVSGIAGNHDVGAPEQPNFVSVLGAWEGRWGITTPRLWETPDVTIACLPWLKGAKDDHLSALLHGLVAQLPAGKPRIVLAHYATDASIYSSGESPVGREPVLRLAELQNLPVDLVVLGHIHKPETLSPSPLIVHPGALTRRDFGEEHDERGFYIIQIGDGPTSWSWHPLPARRFVTLDPRPIYREGIRDAYVRITYRATEEEAAEFDHGKLIGQTQDAGAFHVAGVFPEILRTDRGRAEGLTEATDPLAALETWLGLKADLTEETRAAVRTAAGALLEEVAG